jgi:hypothetical protein
MCFRYVLRFDLKSESFISGRGLKNGRGPKNEFEKQIGRRVEQGELFLSTQFKCRWLKGSVKPEGSVVNVRQSQTISLSHQQLCHKLVSQVVSVVLCCGCDVCGARCVVGGLCMVRAVLLALCCGCVVCGVRCANLSHHLSACRLLLSASPA